MSVTIRLAKVGRKKAPAYKIVVANTRDKRNGKFLEILGHYNPSSNPPTYSLNEERFNQWKAQGALITDSVVKLNEGTYTFKPYDPHAKKETEEAASAKPAEKAEEPAEETTEE